jgi:radical SAM protein with 4Fe4S-binding SPASM domain
MQYPKRVTIELTNKCNRHCEGCPRHKMLYPQGYMNKELFHKIVNELPPQTVIVPFYRGESLLHRDFAEYMQSLKKFKTVQLATNGDYLNRTNQQAILRNVTFLSISLHDYRLPNRTNYLPFLKECRDKGIDTQISILETLVTPSSKKRLKRMWLKHVNRVRIYKEHSTGGFGSMRDCTVGPMEHMQTCNKPFEDMVIYWDGNVGLCNHDWNNSTPLGNVIFTSIADVWQSMRYKEVRLMHTAAMRSNVPTCQACCFQSNQIYGEILNGI